MDLLQLQHRLLEFTSSLFREGYLDEQFTQLQQLQDDSNPDFVAEVVSLFFQDSQKLLDDLSNTLDAQPIDFKKVDAHVHQFKGSSSRYLLQMAAIRCGYQRNRGFGQHLKWSFCDLGSQDQFM